MGELNMIILIVTLLITVGLEGAIFLNIFKAMSDEEREYKRRNGIRDPRFDERQLADRAAACRAGFLTMLVYDGLYLLGKEGFGLVWCEEDFGIGLGALAGLTVFAVVCIRRDAFFKVGSRNTPSAAAAPLGSFLYLSFGIFRDGLWRENGLLTSEALIPLAALYCLILCWESRWKPEFRSAAETKREKKKNAPTDVERL